MAEYFLSDYGSKFQTYRSFSGELLDNGELRLEFSLQIYSNEFWFKTIGQWVCAVCEIVTPGGLTLPEGFDEYIPLGKCIVDDAVSLLAGLLAPYASPDTLGALLAALSGEYARWVTALKKKTAPDHNEYTGDAFETLTNRDWIPGIGRLERSYSALMWKANMSPDITAHIEILFAPTANTSPGVEPFPENWLPPASATIYTQTETEIYYGDTPTPRGFFGLWMDMWEQGGDTWESVTVNTTGNTQEEIDRSAAHLLSCIEATPWYGLNYLPSGGQNGTVASWSRSFNRTHEPAAPDDFGFWQDEGKLFISKFGHRFEWWNNVSINCPEQSRIKQTGRKRGNAARAAAAGIVPIIVILLFLLLLCCVGDTNDQQQHNRRRRRKKRVETRLN